MIGRDDTVFLIIWVFFAFGHTKVVNSPQVARMLFFARFKALCDLRTWTHANDKFAPVLADFVPEPMR